MEPLNSIIDLALSCGFSHAGALDAKTIRLKTAVREACAANKCNEYATNWACPPGCGTLEECAEKIRPYARGVIVQTTGALSGAYDYQAWVDIRKKHKEIFADFIPKMKQLFPDALIIADGACTVCEKCTYPEKPCRFPDKMVSSMEALGMLVSEVCEANGLPYSYGKDTLTYVRCVLID